MLIFFFFNFFLQKIGIDGSCKVTPEETICMKSKSLFSWENKKNIRRLSSAKLTQT